MRPSLEWYSLRVCRLTVEDTPPGTTVCGWGYLPARMTNISRDSRVNSRPSRYSDPVSGFSAVISSAMVLKPWWRSPGQRHRSALGVELDRQVLEAQR